MPNYLVWAILATLCCCLPAGIVAIVYAAQVDGKLSSGDYHGAVEASNNAKMWSWISFGASAVVGVLYFLLILVGGVADSGRF
ncbi:MAG: CD225/dispanin family protein [Arenimonas sp.]